MFFGGICHDFHQNICEKIQTTYIFCLINMKYKFLTYTIINLYDYLGLYSTVSQFCGQFCVHFWEKWQFKKYLLKTYDLYLHANTKISCKINFYLQRSLPELLMWTFLTPSEMATWSTPFSIFVLLIELFFCQTTLGQKDLFVYVFSRVNQN